VVASEEAELRALSAAQGDERRELEQQAVERARLEHRLRQRHSANATLGDATQLGLALLSLLALLYLLYRFCCRRSPRYAPAPSSGSSKAL
jgi:hypothetical protein